MKNLELSLLLRNYQPTLGNVTHVAVQDDFIYFLKDNVLHVRDQHEVKAFDNTYNTIIQFETLIIEKLLWFGTGKEFAWIDSDKKLHTMPLCFEVNAACWNPSQDVLAIVQPDGEVGAFIVNFVDKIITPMGISYLTDEVPETLVKVGWGSETTQFRGTAGKLVKSEDTGTPVNENEDFRPRISWRGNGEMFIVNYYNNGHRKLRVFRFPCELLYESSEIVGLQPIIVWKPEGNLIASVIHTTEKCEIVLFEKNCLLKNSIPLESNLTQVLDLKWSTCGQILAVYQRLVDKSFIDLYTYKNYTWYLKQRLNFAPTNPLVKFEFINNMYSVVSMLVITTQETVTYSFKFVVHVSPLYEAKEAVTSAIINGKSIWLTDCKDGLAPPPVHDRTISIEECVNFVKFHPTEPKIAVIDCYNNIYIYNLETDTEIGNFIVIRHGVDIPIAAHHFIWCFDSQLMCLVEDERYTYKMILNTNDKKWTYWQNSKRKAISRNVRCLDADYTDNVYIEQTSEQIEVYDDIAGTSVFYEVPCFVLSLKYIKIDNIPAVFSLTLSQEMYVNDIKLRTGVSSFIIHQKYLLLTTIENVLLCIRLNTLMLKKNLERYSYERAIEQGGQLLFGVPNSSSVVMQMPRGNVEICAVRMISIDRLEALLKQHNWEEAMRLVRLERMNTTVLVDLNFNRFIENIDKFVQSVKTPDVIIDFLLGLKEENVLTTIYKDCAIVNTQKIVGKVEKVCGALIAYLEKYNYMDYLNCIILVCFLRDPTSASYDVLVHFQNLLNVAKEDQSALKIAESAFNGINSLNRNSNMFDQALLMYDLDLALFVARNLQMDPKQYEPFINSLKTFDEIEQRFVINDHLKKYDVAVKYLMRSLNNDDDAIDYVRKHKVYGSGYNYSQCGSNLHKKMAIIYAEHLRTQKLYEEAGTVLCSVEEFSEAFECYKDGLVVTSAVLTLAQMKLPDAEYKQKLRELAQACLDNRKIIEAGRIYEMYLMDHDTAMDLYIQNDYFSEALMCASKFNCYNDYKFLMFEAVVRYGEELTGKLCGMKDKFNKYKLRLAAVQAAKLAKLSTNYNDAVVDDTLSLADTLSTILTTSSKVSTASRRRRKEEKKKQDLREGGVYEDIALMRALYIIISEIFSLGPIVRELCLIAFNMDNSENNPLSALHNDLVKFQLEVTKSINEIWPPHLNNPKEDDPLSGINDNIKFLDVKYREPPANLDMSWKLDIIKNA